MIARPIAAALLATAMLASAAQAADTTPREIRTDIRFHWEPAKDTVTITYLTGCLSSHGGGQIHNNIDPMLDRDYLQFDLQGRFAIEVPAAEQVNRIGSTDCMGSQEMSVEFTDVERQTYVVNRFGILDRNITLAGEEITFIIKDPKACWRVQSRRCS